MQNQNEHIFMLLTALLATSSLLIHFKPTNESIPTKESKSVVSTHDVSATPEDPEVSQSRASSTPKIPANSKVCGDRFIQMETTDDSGNKRVLVAFNNRRNAFDAETRSTHLFIVPKDELKTIISPDYARFGVEVIKGPDFQMIYVLYITKKEYDASHECIPAPSTSNDQEFFG